MRATSILWVIVLLLLAVIGYYVHPLLGGNGYLRFVGKDVAYHSQFAQACEEVLAQHPAGTNALIWILNANVPRREIVDSYVNWVSGTNISLPVIIGRLQPDAVMVKSDSVHLVIGLQRGVRFGIRWERYDEGPTNLWVLRAFGEAEPMVLYSKTK